MIFDTSLLLYLETMKTIRPPSHPLLMAFFATSTHIQQLQKMTLVLYTCEEDSMKTGVNRGDQEQQDEHQGLLLSYTY